MSEPDPYTSPQSFPPYRLGSGLFSVLRRFATISVVVVLVSLLFAPFISIAIDAYHSASERQRLQYKTDHRALLAASRELMKKYPDQHIKNAEQDPRVPRIIRDLGPSYILISADQLRVELHGGFDHYGFTAYPEGFDAGEHWGKLTDGLYYYSE